MRRSALRWILSTLIVLGMLVIGFLLFSPALQIREVQIERVSPRLDIEHVQDVLAPLFNRHTVFLSKFEVLSALESAIPDLRSAEVSKVFPSLLKVRIELDPLVARLRILEPDAQNAKAFTGATVDFLTSEGLYIATTAVQDTQTFPEIVIVDWGVRPDPNTHMLQPLFLERMNAAELTLLRQFGQEVRERRVFLRAQEFHLALDDFVLWFDTKSPLDDQMSRYRLFLREEDISKVQQYIDLRVSDRVIYQ